MGAKTSAEARYFMQLIRQGKKVPEAAATANISLSQGYRLKGEWLSGKKVQVEAKDYLTDSDNATTLES